MTDIPFALRGQVVTAQRVITDGAIVVVGDQIAWVGESTAAAGAGWGEQIMAAKAPVEGHYLLPGLVDVHCHGGMGADFSLVAEALSAKKAIRAHRRAGTTTLVGSLMSSDMNTMRMQAAILADLCDEGELAGVHFEGPFLSVDKAGAQDEDSFLTPNSGLARELLIVCRGHGVSMTLAPERTGAIGPGGVSETLIDCGAVPSFGHTMANPQVARRALREARENLISNPAARRSARASVTHLFNAMHPALNRQPGPILEFLADAAGGGVVLEIIADGVHVDLAAVRAVIELVGRESVAFVSDAAPVAGLGDGRFLIGERAVEVTGRRAVIAGTDTLLGSVTFLIDQVRLAVEAGIPLVDAVYCASTTPASLIGNGTVGSLESGKQADIVMVSSDLEVVEVWRHGISVVA